MPRRALITGITGQDGAYLAERLLAAGYEVHGATRATAAEHRRLLGPLVERIALHAYHLADIDSLRSLVAAVRPHEIYHLAGPSFIPACTADPLQASELLGMAVVRFLTVLREVDPTIRFFQAGSSEIFGAAEVCPQDESTPLRPRNAYGAGKGFAHWIVQQYREQHGLFACNGILYNHESPRRAEHFVSRKITLAVARIKRGLQQELVLGDLEARRDWGYAGDFVRAMQLILLHERPDDYVIATGQQHSVRELCDAAFTVAGLDYRQFVKTDPMYTRPNDPCQLCGDTAKIRTTLGWTPQVAFRDWIAEMVEADLRDLAILRGQDPLPPSGTAQERKL